jgi:hypothetical protein
MIRAAMLQLPLPFPDDCLWSRLSPAAQEQCQALLSQMLREVVVKESQAKEERHEPEDPTQAS